MNKSIFTQVDAAIICLVLFGLMLLMVSFGNRVRQRLWKAKDADIKGGVSSFLGALFGLWAFMLAFTFGQSGTRFENVRAAIVDESNFLRTAILRADFFPDSVREVYRSELKQYLEERIAYYDYAGNKTKFKENREAITKTATLLWATTVEQSRKPNLASFTGPMAASLTSLFDIGIKREALLSYGVPVPIIFILITLALTISFIGGFTAPAIKNTDWMLIAVFALVAVAIVYVIIDLARPMEGLIRPDSGQQAIINLRKLF
jgi:hypothetical protein